MHKGARIMLVLMAPILYAGQQAVSNPIGQRLINDVLDTQVHVLGEKTKQILGDPYMPSVLLSVVNDSVDALLPDAKRLVQNKTNELIRYQASPNSLLSNGNVIIVGGGAMQRKKQAEMFGALRAFVPSPVLDGVSTAASYVPSRDSVSRAFVPVVVHAPMRPCAHASS